MREKWKLVGFSVSAILFNKNEVDGPLVRFRQWCQHHHLPPHVASLKQYKHQKEKVNLYANPISAQPGDSQCPNFKNNYE